MFKYYLWKEGVGSEGVVSEEKEKSERSVVLANQAVKHFTHMESLDVTPSPRGNVDAFVCIHAKVLPAGL